MIGTGSSGTQLIPLVAEKAGHLTVFVRTPNYHAPAINRPLTDEDQQHWKRILDKVRARLRTFEVVGSGDVFMSDEDMVTRNHPGHHYTAEQRREIFQKRWAFGRTVMPRAFADVMTNLEINEEVSSFLREKVAEIVEGPETAEILAPRTFRFGTKRICVGTNFYETFNRDNVEAVDVKGNPIERFTEKGLIVGGEEIELDAIICASGFDALTGELTVIDICGVGGRTIKDAWAHGADTYLGFGIAGFPNLHMIGSPRSPSVLVNVVMANEYQVEWIADLIEHMRRHRLERVDVDADAQAKWSQIVRDAIKGTVLETAESWYVGANVPGKARGMVQIPRPERFAVHKLIVADRRLEGTDSLKAVKDRLKAEFLITVLYKDRPDDLRDAMEDALSRGRRWRERITASVARQPTLQKIPGEYL